MGATGKPFADICNGDLVVVATNSMQESTLNVGEGWIWWRVLDINTAQTGWMPEVTLDGTIRNVDKDGPRPYTVVAGDTLLSIARHFGLGLEALRTANPGVNDPLSAGQKLTLP
jgi:hypothetical protein